MHDAIGESIDIGKCLREQFAALPAVQVPQCQTLIEIGELVEIDDDCGTIFAVWNDERWKLPAGTKLFAAPHPRRLEMSGGRYDYAYYPIQEFAEGILEDVTEAASSNDIPIDVRYYMRKYAVKLLEMSKVAKDIEWYMSGDIGEEKLRETFKKWEIL